MKPFAAACPHAPRWCRLLGMKMAKHICALLHASHNHAMRSSPHHHGRRVNLKERVQKNTAIQSAPHVHTLRPTNLSSSFNQLHSSSVPLFCPYSHPDALPLPATTDQALHRPPHAMPQADAAELFALFKKELVLNNAEPTACVHALCRPHHVARHLTAVCDFWVV